jgi:hypothetical protein
MSKISAFLGKLNYLKIIKYTVITLWLSVVSFLLILQYALDGLWENHPYSSERIWFKKGQFDVYLSWYCWGITCDHEAILVSSKPYLGNFENDFRNNIIFKLHKEELFFKTNNFDTLIVYSHFQGRHDSLLFDSLNCKIILKKIDSTSDFKRYNIHKYNCNNYGYRWLGYK